MSEIRFLVRQDGNIIHVCNKNAGSYLGYFIVKDNYYYLEDEEDKLFTNKSDAINRVIEKNIRGE